MACVVQIGAGGVGGVVAHKMAMNREVFSHIVLASRTIEKCHAIAESIRAKGLGEIVVDSVDADSVDSVVGLIQKHKPKLVINVALPYQDLAIMEACLQTGVHYLDTANYEHPDSAHFEYKEQWAYDTRFKQAGLFALLGSGFDPGVTNVFCAYAQKHYFDEIESIDILDCNAGDHGYAFATNFNPEINLREVSSKARYWVSSNSSLGNHSHNPSTPLHCGARSSAPHSQGEAIAQSNTANTRIVCGEIRDSKANSESTTSDSRPISESAPSVIASIAKQATEKDSKTMDCHADKSARNDDKTGFATHTSLESPTDSKNLNPLVSPTDLAFNPDLQQDTIYRKFEREEKHFELDSNTQDLCTESYAGGQWRDIAPLALMKEWDYPEVGVKNSYLLYHEELESLVRNIRGLKRIRFFMTFGESYLTHMKCLENIGFLRIDEVAHKGGKIVPIEVLKTLLPDPASLAPRTKGQTHIGCYIKGRKDGKERTIYIYNICEHESCYKEVNAQGVSYTTGVPAMIGAKLICEGKWGIGTIKNSSLGNHSRDCVEFGGQSLPLEVTPAPKSTQSPQSNTANTRILDSGALDSQSCHSEAIAEESKCQDSKVADFKGISESATSDSKTIESYNAQRLKLNADMPQGGEYQGIDNAAELCAMEEKRQASKYAEASLSDFSGFGAKGAGSLLDINDQALSEQSAKSTKEATQGAGVWNMEQNDPDPFMHELNIQGLPYIVVEIESSGAIRILEDGRKQI